MNKPTIVLDIDGVCSDFVGALLPPLRTILGRNVTYTDITKYKYWREDCLGMTTAQKDTLDRAVQTRGFCAGIAPIPGAVAGIRELQECADVYAATVPYDSEHWERERRLWIQKILGIPNSNIMQGEPKHLLDCHALVEDKPETLEDWQSIGRPQYGILFDQPWNASHPWSGVRVHSWDELVAFLHQRVL